MMTAEVFGRVFLVLMSKDVLMHKGPGEIRMMREAMRWLFAV